MTNASVTAHVVPPVDKSILVPCDPARAGSEAGPSIV